MRRPIRSPVVQPALRHKHKPPPAPPPPVVEAPAVIVPSRPLRSVMVGDCDHYLSPYIFGVAQGMARLGHWHSQVSIRQPAHIIEQRIRDLRPHILWTHMLLWPPGGARVDQLLPIVERSARAGTKVVIHDGDYKEPTRHPHPLPWCSLALVNHAYDRSAWKVPTLHWPYFAFAQDEIAPPNPDYACALWFAGTVGTGPVYGARSAFLVELRKLGVDLKQPSERDGNTLFRTAEVAASADAVLGFGRPGARGWRDTRIGQYAGAGAILLHDDVGGMLEPLTHYMPYRSGDPESVVEALRLLRALPGGERRAMRERAFRFVQEKHSSVARVRQVLQTLNLGGGNG